MTIYVLHRWWVRGGTSKHPSSTWLGAFSSLDEAKLAGQQASDQIYDSSQRLDWNGGAGSYTSTEYWWAPSLGSEPTDISNGYEIQSIELDSRSRVLEEG